MNAEEARKKIVEFGQELINDKSLTLFGEVFDPQNIEHVCIVLYGYWSYQNEANRWKIIAQTTAEAYVAIVPEGKAEA